MSDTMGDVILGARDVGVRFGGFVALYGIPETIGLIEHHLVPVPMTAPGTA